jgi:transposase
MELKAVPAHYEDASQLAKYRDAMEARGDERIIMWLVAPLIPPSVREFLTHIGIEFTEIHECEFMRVANMRGVEIHAKPKVLENSKQKDRVPPSELPNASRTTMPKFEGKGRALVAASQKEVTTIPWLTLKEAARRLDCSYRTIRRFVVLGKIESRVGDKRGRNGRYSKEINLASLLDYVRTKYQDTKSLRHPKKRAECSLPESHLTYFSSSSDAGCSTFSDVKQASIPAVQTPKAQKKRERKLEILKPLLDYLANPSTRSRFHQLTLANGEHVANSDMLASYLSEKYGVSRRSVWRWKRMFIEEGRYALARKSRTDKGRSAWAEKNRDLAVLAAMTYMGKTERPAQSMSVAYQALCERAQRQGDKPPSYSTVRAFLSNQAEVSHTMRLLGRARTASTQHRG